MVCHDGSGYEFELDESGLVVEYLGSEESVRIAVIMEKMMGADV